MRSEIISNHTQLFVGLQVCHLLGTCFFLDQLFPQILHSWVFPSPGDSSKNLTSAEGLSLTPYLHKVMDPPRHAQFHQSAPSLEHYIIS